MQHAFGPRCLNSATPQRSPRMIRNCVGDADSVVAHLAKEAGIPIVSPAAERQVKARSPDAVCMRGAVWAPPTVDGDTTASCTFVSVSLAVATTCIQSSYVLSPYAVPVERSSSATSYWLHFSRGPLQTALEQLKRDAEDEELVETVSCDGTT
jgi:hypothetical protein